MHVRRRDARAAVVHGGSLYTYARVCGAQRPGGAGPHATRAVERQAEPRPGPRVRAGGLLRRLVAAWRHTVCEMGAVTWFSSVCGLTIAVSPGSASRCARLSPRKTRRASADRRSPSRPIEPAAAPHASRGGVGLARERAQTQEPHKSRPGVPYSCGSHRPYPATDHMRSAPSGLARQSRSISATSPSSCAPQRRLRLTRQARQPAVQGVGTAIPITDTPWAQRTRA